MKRIIGITFTALLIFLIIMTGPAKAVNIDLSTDKTIYEQGDSIIFTASVDLQNPDLIPAQELKLLLNDALVCSIGLTGSILSGCNGMSIEVINNAAAYGYGYNQGSGFGLENGTLVNKTTFFGYGYGYGYSTSTPIELIYKITWDSSDAAIGDYDAKFALLASNSNSFEYMTEDSSSFKIVLTTTNRIQEDVYAEEPGTIIINGTNSFDNVAKATFNGDFRLKNINDTINPSILGGYGTLNLDVYKNDSTHINLQLSFDPETVMAFRSNKTDLIGNAKVRYQRNKKGIRVNNQWIGGEPTVKFNGDISNVRFTRDSSLITITSDDPLFTLNVGNMIVTKLDHSEYNEEFSFNNGRPVRKTIIDRTKIP